MAALLHHHGAGAGVWDPVLCAGMGLRPGAAARAVVHYLLLRLPEETLDTAIWCLTILTAELPLKGLEVSVVFLPCFLYLARTAEILSA